MLQNIRGNIGNKFKEIQKYVQGKNEPGKLQEKQNEATENSVMLLEPQNGPVMLNYGAVKQNDIHVYDTQLWSEDRFQTIWEVSCQLEKGDKDVYEFLWKVQLKLKPKRKTVIIQQVNKIYNTTLDNGNIQPADRKYKVVLVGDSGVGKTSFIRRICRDTFKLSFHTTVGVDYQEKDISVSGKRYTLQLWDTAGQERFRSMCVQYYRNADAIIAIYDVTCETSFKNIRWWMNTIKENTSDEKILMVIGNKTDAVDFRLANGVKTAHGENIAKEFGALFFETSVKFDENVKESIYTLAKTFHKKSLDERSKLQLEEINKEKKKRRWC